MDKWKLNNWILFLLIVTFISCNKEKKVVKTFYDNGKIHTITSFNKDNKIEGLVQIFFDSGELQANLIYKNGIEIDSSVYFHKNGKIQIVSYPLKNDYKLNKYFYKNGKLSREGKLKNFNKIGWWKFYNNDGSLKEEIEFLDINDMEHLKFRNREYINQYKKYKLGKLLKKESSFFALNLNDTLTLGKSIGDIIYTSEFSDQSVIYVCIGYDLKPDFSNISQVKLDTFGIQKEDTWFGVKYQSPGKKTLRGFIIEDYYKKIKTKSNDKSYDIIKIPHRKYFEKSIYVK